MKKKRVLIMGLIVVCGLVSGVVSEPRNAGGVVGSIERLDPRLDALLAEDVEIEILAEGFRWVEGPVWVADGGYLLFSDIPANTIYRWQEGEALVEFMRPSGFTGDGDGGREPGSNGLAMDGEGRLVLCEHGDRRLARLVSLDDPNGEKVTLAERYDGKRFNSPNDLAIHSSGAIYFTDPPYGLAGGVNDPARELEFSGVYRLDPDGTVALLTKELERPNGIALSPDEKLLYVSNSQGNRAIWMVYALAEDGMIGEGRVFFDATSLVSAERVGSPDGLKVDVEGNLFATGPGGVLVIAPDGTHLGTVLTGRRTANCAFGDDGSVLYMTADKHLLRVRTTTQGLKEK